VRAVSTAASTVRHTAVALSEALLILAIAGALVYGAALLTGLRPLGADFVFGAQMDRGVSKQTLDGVLSIRHGDDFAGGRISGHSYFLKSDGRETELAFEGAPPDDQRSGTRIRVHGVSAGRTFLVADGGTESLASAPASTSTSIGAKRVAIVLINFMNDASEPFTPEFAAGIAFSNTNSVAAYYAASSYGQLMLTGEVFGWYTIPDTNGTCATDTWAASAATVADAAGVTLSAYDNVVFAFPTVSGCGWAGLAQMPGRFSWLNGAGAMNLRAMAHELGHNFGTHHASTLTCAEAGVRVSLAANPADCSTSEYGDPYTVMGQASHYEHTNYSRGNFGWLEATNTLTVTTTGDYALEATETPGTNVVRALRMARTSSSYLMLELRGPSDPFDTFATTAPAVTGVSVRITSGYSVRTQSQLVDANPSTTSFLDAPLSAGQTLVDPVSRISITTVAMSAAGATVHVTFDTGPSPTPAPIPTPEPTPSTTPDPTPSPTPDPTPSPTQSPTPDSTPSPTASPVTTASPTATPTPTATATDTQPPNPPAGLTATLVKGKRLQLSWKPSTDNVAVAGYLIYRNGTQIGTVATTTFSDTVGGRRSSTSYWVIAFDSSRNLSPPSDPIVVSP
jgi:hypothetical protein